MLPRDRCIDRRSADLPQHSRSAIHTSCICCLTRFCRTSTLEQDAGDLSSISVGASGDYIPLAPLPEQRRIVAEIEKQFSRLDAGVAALNASGQPETLPGVGAQGRVRGPAGAPGSRRRAGGSPAGAHPGRAAREVGGGASGQEVRRAGRAGDGRAAGVAGGVVLGDDSII